MGSLSPVQGRRPKAEISWRFVAARWAAFHLQGVYVELIYRSSKWRSPCLDQCVTLTGKVLPWQWAWPGGWAARVGVGQTLQLLPLSSACVGFLPSTGGGESAVAGSCSLVEMLDWGRTFPQKGSLHFSGLAIRNKKKQKHFQPLKL